MCLTARVASGWRLNLLLKQNLSRFNIFSRPHLTVGHSLPSSIPDLQRCFLGARRREDRMFSEGWGIMHGLTPDYLCCRWCLETWYGRQSGQQSLVSRDFSPFSNLVFSSLLSKMLPYGDTLCNCIFCPSVFQTHKDPSVPPATPKSSLRPHHHHPPYPLLCHASISRTSLWVFLLLRKQVACWVNRQRPVCPAPLRMRD